MIKSKKRWGILGVIMIMLLVPLMFILTACDEIPGSQTPGGEIPGEETQEKLVSTYLANTMVTETIATGARETDDISDSHFSITLKNGADTGIVSTNEGRVNCTYEIEGDEITINLKFPSSPTNTTWTGTIDGNDIELLVQSDSVLNVYYVYTYNEEASATTIKPGRYIAVQRLDVDTDGHRTYSDLTASDSTKAYLFNEDGTYTYDPDGKPLTSTYETTDYGVILDNSNITPGQIGHLEGGYIYLLAVAYEDNSMVYYLYEFVG